MTIMRVWRGYTKPENADAYERLLREEILPGIHRINGYKGTHLLRRNAGDEVEFVTITTWDSWDAIREFAGPEGHAVVPEEARKLLARGDDESLHYDAVWVP